MIVEDGSGVAGANALATPGQVAALLAERATLVAGAVLASSAVSFATGGAMTVPAALGLVASRLIRIEGAAELANSGWAYVKSIAAPVSGSVTATLAWLETALEAAGAPISIGVYDPVGWWSATPQALEGSIVAATESLGQLTWIGEITYDYQTTSWPRSYAYTCKEGRRPFGSLLSPNEIPAEVVEAIARLAADHLVASLDAVATAQPDTEGQLKRKKIGPIEREWFAAPSSGSKARAARPWLAPLLRGLYYERGNGPARSIYRTT